MGALAYSMLFDHGLQRGQVLRLSPIENYYQIEEAPFCVTVQHFCLVMLESGEALALYAYDTHQPSRERSCDITWRPEMSFEDPATGERSNGWFRSGCSGTTYRMNGERVFGPGPRDMDRFATRVVTDSHEFEGGTFEEEYLEVDTRSLICGEPAEGAPGDCEFAPLPQ